MFSLIVDTIGFDSSNVATLTIATFFVFVALSICVFDFSYYKYIESKSNCKEEYEGTKSEEDLPGPTGLPFFGYMPFIGKYPHKTLASLAERLYKRNMFSLKAGCRRFVVLSNFEEIKKIANQFPEELFGKPRTFTTDKLSVGAHNDMIERWKKRRAYTNAGLKYLESYNIPGIITEEVRNIVDFFISLSSTNKAHDVRHDVTYFVSRVLYRMSYGSQPDVMAQRWLSKIVHSLPDYTTTIGSFSIFDLIPYLRHFYSNKFKKFVNFNLNMSKFCQNEKLKHLSDSKLKSSETTPRDLFEFFHQKLQRMKESEKDKFNLKDGVLYDGLEDIIRAGTESSSLIIQWFLLYMTAFPNIQNQMQNEIDNYMTTKKKKVPTATLR